MAALAQRQQQQQQQQHLLVDDVLEFLRGVDPALDGDVFERFVQHDVLLEDLRDPGFDGEALQRMGIVKVGVQLRILRAINAAFPAHRRGSGGGGGGGSATSSPIRGRPHRPQFETEAPRRRPPAYSDGEMAAAARTGGAPGNGKTLLTPTIVSSRAYRRSKLPPPPPGVRPAPVLIATKLSGEMTEREKREEQERKRWEAEERGERETWETWETEEGRVRGEEEGWDTTPPEPPARAPTPPSPGHRRPRRRTGSGRHKKKKKKKYHPPEHGITLEALESMDARLVPHVLCVLTPSSRPLWGKYAGRLGREILARVEMALEAAPAGLPDFEVPVIINMLLWESTRTSFVSLFHGGKTLALGDGRATAAAEEEGTTTTERGVVDNGNGAGAAMEEIDRLVDTDELIRCVLPQPGDFTFEWFRSAPDDAVEALVLPFDRKLVDAYAERPSDLIKCLVDAVQVRVREHIIL
jgi:hypothetical protein